MNFAVYRDARLNSLAVINSEQIPLITLPAASIQPIGSIAYDLSSNRLVISNGEEWIPYTE